MYYFCYYLIIDDVLFDHIDNPGLFSVLSGAYLLIWLQE